MNIEICYPGFLKKAISFTIDDGNYILDKKFIDIVKPYGIKGTFNLVGASQLGSRTHEQYREFYSGFEIANHCKFHPKVILPTDNYIISDEEFDTKTADPALLYKSDIPGLYHKFYRTWWGYVATTEAYIRFIDEGKRELDEIFGEENVTAFVWPYHEQNDEALHIHLKEYGYKSVRKTGEVGFEVPKDKMSWSYNAIHKNLLSRAEEYMAYQSDKLTFLCFGVHSHDFENDNCWYILEEFAKRYGKREDEIFYATVGEIFDYSDAADMLIYGENSITNPTNITLYIKVNGKNVVLAPNESYKI